MQIRQERPGDEAAIADVHARAFRQADAPGDAAEVPVEVTLVEQLRACDGWIPALSLVAVDGDDLVGHVVCTRGYVRPEGEAVLGLGPLGVDPGHQRRGLGTALMHAVIGAADELDELLVALLGDPAYYGRFGFEASTALDIESPDPTWGVYFQARPLRAYRPDITGTFEYAAPFRHLG